MALRKKTLLKVIVLGDSRVGKTSLLSQYVSADQSKTLSREYKATTDADFVTKDVLIDDRIITLQIWDTPGAERSPSLPFYRGAHGCVLCFDVGNPQSFESLAFWRQAFLASAAPRDPAKFPFVVIGYKGDRMEPSDPDCDHDFVVVGGVTKNRRVVSEEQVESWCRSMANLAYFEVTAEEAGTVAAAFEAVARRALAYTEQGSFPELQVEHSELVLRSPAAATTAARSSTSGCNCCPGALRRLAACLGRCCRRQPSTGPAQSPELELEPRLH